MTPEETEAEAIAREVHDRFDRTDVPTIFADGYVGTATANGLERITLAHQRFNTEPSAQRTAVHPVAVLVMPTSSLLEFSKSFLEKHGFIVGKPDDQAH